MQQINKKRQKQAEIWFCKGLSASDQDDLVSATTAYQNALELNPNHLKANYNLALLNHNKNDFDNARLGYIKTITLQPDFAEAYKNLGDINFSQGRTSEAIFSYKQAISINPRYPEAWYNLGLSERQLNHLDSALEAYCQAIKLRPNYTQALNSIPAITQQIGKFSESTQFLTKLALANSQNIEVRICLAELYFRSERIEQSLATLQEITKIDPQNGEALNLAGLISSQMGDAEEALNLLTKAHRSAPDSAKIHSNLLYAHLMDPQSSIENYRRIAQDWWQQHALPTKSTYDHHRLLTHNQPLRLGFISADFHRHSVSYFFLPLIQNLRPKEFTIYCYSDTYKVDDYTTKIKKHTDSWRPIYGLNHKMVADLIDRDQIDILVELSGHTANNRLPVLAEQPAPLQLSWLGYPASTGIPSGTYRLTDQNVDPEENRTHYSEPLAYLPHIFLCYAPPPEALSLTTTKNTNKNEIIFASFNNPAKTNLKVINTWAKILQAVPTAQLLLKNRGLKNKTITNSFKKKFELLGINPDRIIFHPGNIEESEHFTVYQQVDIALDTFPYNGTTTTCEALWMGVPIIALKGTTHAARVGATLMKALGHPELIAENEEEYIRKAVELSQNRMRLNFYKQTLRLKMQQSPLMDAAQFARDFSSTLKERFQVLSNQPETLSTNSDHNNTVALAQSLSDCGRENEALELLNTALRQSPNHPELHFQLANIYHKKHQLEKALLALRQCLAFNLQDARAWSNLGYILQNKGSKEEAMAVFRRALKINPEQMETTANLLWHLHQECNWGYETIRLHNKLSKFDNRARKKNLRPATSLFLHLALVDDQTTNFQQARNSISHASKNIPGYIHQKPSGKEDRVLKIGYLSGDFRDHPVAHNIVNLFQLHDRSKFEVFAYSCAPNDNSSYRKKIKKGCDSFVDIHHLTDDEGARCIKNDNIDILIELMGHTRNNRLRLCAFRPAPIQVTYLGYPGTTGADFIDYLIADKIVVPNGDEKYYSEQIIYLPDGFMIADRAPIGPSPKRSDYDLPDKGFIFCSFNNAYKIEPVMFNTWMEILQQVPDSVLWLRKNNQRMIINLRKEAKKRGIDPNRLIFAEKVDDKKDHLARLQLANLYLDTRIYNGHTTTLDALWAGVPAITLKGHHFASRVSSSNLHNIGLNELITPDLESYQTLAVKLACNPKELSRIRDKLAINKTTRPLFDTEKTVRNLEAAYLEMWHCHTNTPQFT